ncbi:MAG: Uma2 family endonuclease [Armatimonadaceae bacterium]
MPTTTILSQRTTRDESALLVGTMTLAEYLAHEQATGERHEFLEGQVFRMPGGSPTHNMIVVDTTVALSIALQRAGVGDVLGSDQKVAVGGTRYRYPDVTVIGTEPQFDENNALLNPVLLVEVLSPSTEREDRTDKFRDYQQLRSLRHYILIEQDRVSVTHFEKMMGELWAIVGDYTEISANLQIRVSDVPVSVPLASVYRRASLASAAEENEPEAS